MCRRFFLGCVLPQLTRSFRGRADAFGVASAMTLARGERAQSALDRRSCGVREVKKMCSGCGGYTLITSWFMSVSQKDIFSYDDRSR